LGIIAIYFVYIGFINSEAAIMATTKRIDAAQSRLFIFRLKIRG